MTPAYIYIGEGHYDGPHGRVEVVKVGFTTDAPADRLYHTQQEHRRRAVPSHPKHHTGNWHSGLTLRLVAYYRVSSDSAEAHAHRILDRYRIRGTELFTCRADVARVACSVASTARPRPAMQMKPFGAKYLASAIVDHKLVQGRRKHGRATLAQVHAARDRVHQLLDAGASNSPLLKKWEFLLTK